LNGSPLNSRTGSPSCDVCLHLRPPAVCGSLSGANYVSKTSIWSLCNLRPPAVCGSLSGANYVSKTSIWSLCILRPPAVCGSLPARACLFLALCIGASEWKASVSWLIRQTCFLFGQNSGLLRRGFLWRLHPHGIPPSAGGFLPGTVRDCTLPGSAAGAVCGSS